MKDMVSEAIDYFKSEAVYDKVFYEFKRKYESLGRVGGGISLASYSGKEIATLARFLGVRRDKLCDKRRITLQQFERQLNHYRFDDLSLKQLLEAYFNESLISNKERAEGKHLERQHFFEQLVDRYVLVKDWLTYIETKPSDSHWIQRLIDYSFREFEKKIDILNKSIQFFPKEPIRLPVFAQKMTKNPHAFDRTENLGKLFIHLLAVKRAISKNKKVIVPTTSEDISELLLEYNILRDDITNDVTIANLLADTTISNKHKIWEAACETNSVLNVPIRELLDLKSLYPHTGRKEVWIVENSGIFSSLLDAVPTVPLMCTHGQFKLAVWKALDLLVEHNCHLYYSGDLDPEGVGMADRLCRRYPNHVKLWKMNAESYAKALSEEEQISAVRLKKLSKVKHAELQEVKKLMLQVKSPGYQEALLEEMIVELKEMN